MSENDIDRLARENEALRRRIAELEREIDRSRATLPDISELVNRAILKSIPRAP